MNRVQSHRRRSRGTLEPVSRGRPSYGTDRACCHHQLGMSEETSSELDPLIFGEVVPATEHGVRAAVARRAAAVAPVAKSAAVATAGATVVAAAAVVVAKATGISGGSGSRTLRRSRMPKIESTSRILIEVHQLAER